MTDTLWRVWLLLSINQYFRLIVMCGGIVTGEETFWVKMVTRVFCLL